MGQRDSRAGPPPTPPSIREGSKRRAETWGRRAETLAALYLQLKGWRVLARRVRTPAGEIDLVTRRGRQIAFVEVKARPDLASAAVAIGPRNQQRISRASKFLLARFCRRNDSARFDVVLIRPWRWPVHFEGAWLGD